MNKILDLFGSFADAYLTFWNDFSSVTKFCEYYEIDSKDFLEICDIKKRMPLNSKICELDYYVNIFIHKKIRP